MGKLFEKLEREAKDDKAKRAGLEKEISAFEEEKLKLEAEAQAAAEDGNADLYLELEKKTERLGAQIYVRKIQLAKIPTIYPEESVLAAWNELAEDFSKVLHKKWPEYEKARGELCQKYMDIVRDQAAMESAREHCLELAGMGRDDRGKLKSERINNNFILPGQYVLRTSPEMLFFTTTKTLDGADKEIQELAKVLYEGLA